jgi:hypothetical protein
MGALGGYTDQWLGNELAGSEAGRKISLANSNAEQIKSLLAAERQDAEIKATHRTSPWGTALTVAGNIMGAAGGVPGLRAIYCTACNSSPSSVSVIGGMAAVCPHVARLTHVYDRKNPNRSIRPASMSHNLGLRDSSCCGIRMW